MRAKPPKFGKFRLPASTKFPDRKAVQLKAQSLGCDLLAEEPGEESCQELTAWYVEKFCQANNLTQ